MPRVPARTYAITPGCYATATHANIIELLYTSASTRLFWLAASDVILGEPVLDLEKWQSSCVAAGCCSWAV